MRRTSHGSYIMVATRTERARAFVPGPLPPYPPIEWTVELLGKFDKAALAVGRLGAVENLLSDAELLVPLQMLKEAALSSTSESKRAGMAEMLLSRIDTERRRRPDVDAINRLNSAALALWEAAASEESLDPSLFIQAYRLLTDNGDETADAAGVFRKNEKRLSVTQPGNASFVPPPADTIADCMASLDSFLRDRPEPTPFLVKAALAHAQLELIQPFSVGNSRIARLVTMMVVRERGVLKQPLLCPSFHFSLHAREYFEALNKVRNFGEWEEWLMFFADSICESATHSFESLRRMTELTTTDTDAVIGLGRPSESALGVFFAMFVQPVATSNWLVSKTGLTAATVNKSLAHLEDLGLVRELTSRRRNRIFCYTGLLEAICDGTDLDAFTFE